MQCRDRVGSIYRDVHPLLNSDSNTVLGFSILESEARPPRVMAPARKGKRAWLE
jgi:hypothetical protein